MVNPASQVELEVVRRPADPEGQRLLEDLVLPGGLVVGMEQEVRMGVDQAGQERHPGEVDRPRPLRGLHLGCRAGGGDRPIARPGRPSRSRGVGDPSKTRAGRSRTGGGWRGLPALAGPVGPVPGIGRIDRVEGPGRSMIAPWASVAACRPPDGAVESVRAGRSRSRSAASRGSTEIGVGPSDAGRPIADDGRPDPGPDRAVGVSSRRRRSVRGPWFDDHVPERSGAVPTAVLSLPVGRPSGRGPKRPNIVFLFSDDHAYQAIGAYNDPRKLVETPNIDRIGREGMRFDRCVVPELDLRAEPGVGPDRQVFAPQRLLQQHQQPVRRLAADLPQDAPRPRATRRP